MDSNRVSEIVVVLVVVVVIFDSTVAMTPYEKRELKNQVLEMFDHAYKSYMNYAFPADELMPLSCKGRFRGTHPNRGDVDDSLGNFTLSLIDSLDSLAILGKLEDFEQAVQLVIANTKFDADAIVSVFETNIRVLGGLLGGHVAATSFKRRKKAVEWYDGELLEMAREVGLRLLPAFNTTTGMPYPRINLKHGITTYLSANVKDTCTACAGTMILEFAALSRLTGDPQFEEKARKAMDYLWHQRHRSTDLMGTVINIHNGDWIRRESGVGAGIDSYYEYVLKAYILLGDESYLDRFNKHYTAVMKYISQGPLLVDVHMHKPQSPSKNFMDALLAFWPGLQVLKGDLDPAVETHEMLYQIVQRHNFLPEAFTTDFRIHWGHHPLRPEFVESTYFLYKATGDPYYLEAGKKVIENLNEHARVPCGFAALKDVTSGTHEDQMDSYVLAETFKYLYLLFSEKSDHVLDVDDYVFTTEAHILPLSLSVFNSSQVQLKIDREAYGKLKDIQSNPTTDCYKSTPFDEEIDDHNTCPNFHIKSAGGSNFAHDLRHPMKDLVNRVSPKPNRNSQRLKAVEFIAGNKEQLEQLNQMGIRIATMSDGRVQLLHTASEAATPEDAEDGMRFMQEMIELSKKQKPEAQHDPMYVQMVSQPYYGSVYYKAGPAQFGYDLKALPPVQGKLGVADPIKACTAFNNIDDLGGKIVIIERGDCMFVDKARNLMHAGAIGGIVLDHNEGTSGEVQALFAMSGDGREDITIPMVFLFHKEGHDILTALQTFPDLQVLLTKLPKSQDSFSPAEINVKRPEGPGSITVTPNVYDPTHQYDADTGQPVPSDPSIKTDSPDSPDDQHIFSIKTGSKKIHMKVHVSTSPNEPTIDSKERDDGVLQLDILPDGSKQLTFNLNQKKSSDEKKSKPQLNQIYVDLVQILQERTNFPKLSDQPEYLIAIARFLESAYFNFAHVDSKATEMIEKLAAELIFQKTARDIEAIRTGKYDLDKKNLEDSESQDNSDKGEKSYVKLVPPDEESGKKHGAIVDENGVLKILDDNLVKNGKLINDPLLKKTIDEFVESVLGKELNLQPANQVSQENPSEQSQSEEKSEMAQIFNPLNDNSNDNIVVNEYSNKDNYADNKADSSPTENYTRNPPSSQEAENKKDEL
ncbi:hypothetical protein SNE40_001268 [Patella caerulea]|uniref:alpha-1,2-Mannosidase n=1 Tax=Patella caerulea TaxID=87958 RepID=A0AAN8K6U6_PATCE